MNDDKYTAMPTGFPKMEIEDGEMKFKFRIPKFNQNSLIDPIVTPGKSSSSSAVNTLWMQISIILLFQVATLYLAYWELLVIKQFWIIRESREVRNKKRNSNVSIPLPYLV